MLIVKLRAGSVDEQLEILNLGANRLEAKAAALGGQAIAPYREHPQRRFHELLGQVHPPYLEHACELASECAPFVLSRRRPLAEDRAVC